MSPISRGFRGRRPQADPSRIPPGQYLTHDFPVLAVGIAAYLGWGFFPLYFKLLEPAGPVTV